MSGPSTTGPAPVVPGRWRFATAVDVAVGETDAMSSSANYRVVELYVTGPVPTLGAIQATLFGADSSEAPVRGWVARKDLADLLPRGIRVPMLMPEHQDSGWYQPLGTSAFIGEPGPQDVRQGRLGDCKLLSAMQSLAAMPGGRAHLRKIITAVEKGGGTFDVRLRTNLEVGADSGGFEHILVDNYFPVTRDKGAVLYAPSGRTVKDAGTFPIWPALLEKAFALAWGGYPKLVETSPGEVTDTRIFATLGIPPLGTPNTMVCTGKSGSAVKNFVAKPFGDGATFVAAAGFRPHNWAVIGADEDYLYLADPYGTRESYEREGGATLIGENGKDVLWNKSFDKFPVKLPWALVPEYVRGLTRFITPKAPTEGKDSLTV